MNKFTPPALRKRTQLRLSYPLIAIALFLYHPSASAAPTVEGNVISVPDNGWYQFQRASDFASICEGTSTCTVSPGIYHVINLSNGERFENISISAEPAPESGGSGGSSSGITVGNGTLRWPNDGWYQVQRADNFASVCEGGSGCDVPAGTYTIINHSTGERFQNIVVGTGASTGSGAGTGLPTASGGVSVTGNTISWPGVDWYQVQSVVDYSTICEGGNSCTVEPGVYQVINHTSGVKIDNLEVGGSGGISSGGGGSSTGNAPSVPPNFRSVIYSNTQAEIFWDASSDNGVVVGYDIFRNGSLIEGMRDARSFFESSLEPGTIYQYQLLAVDNENNRSTAASLQFTTPGGSGSTTPPPAGSGTLPAAGAPLIDGSNQVSWAFAPVDSGLELIVEPFVQMPLASNGNPARWNAMTSVGDRIFIVDEKDGRMYEITNREVNLWFDIAAAVQNSTGRSIDISNPFHGGVRGIAFHPDFSNNGKLYTTLLEERPANTSLHHYLSDAAALNVDSVLVEWTINPGTFTPDPSSYREVFRVGIPEFDHPIKQIAFDPSATPGSGTYGLLYIAHGDGSIESTTSRGGQRNDALGKILRINPLASGSSRYTVPGSNPFTSDPNMLNEAFSIGHRNPHHLAFISDGTLVVAEDGRDNIDEINLIVAGSDYGWSVREGAYLPQASGGLANGITTLPAGDAGNRYTYPAAQFGHTGTIGSTFTGQALGGGYVIENGSELDGQYFYIDFPRSGEVFHSRVADLRAATTQGDPANLTVARTGRASIRFDHDANPGTEAQITTMREVVQSADSYVNTNDRVDIRYGQGPQGEIYLMNKRNSMVYLVSNSLPAGSSSSGPGSSGPVGTGRPASDSGTHGFDTWNRMSSAAQTVTPSDCLLTAGGYAGPFYCFSPFDRRLMRIENDGSITWQFPLPGENASNHIEAIEFINGFQVATFADATPSPDDSAFDMSVFNQTGAYQGTVHIIPDIENLGGLDFAGVNLDGLDLIVRAGPTRQNAPSGLESELYTNDIFIYGEHYSEIEGADLSRLSGWSKQGAFRARIDSRSGDTLNTRLFPGSSAAAALAECPIPSVGNSNLDSCG